MTPKQRRFVAEYLKDHNGKEAAIRAGFSSKSAKAIACELLSKPEVRAELEDKMVEVEDKAIVDAAYVLTSLKEVSKRCMVAEPVLEYNPETRQKEETGEWKFDSAGANRSLELLGKHLKLFTDKVEHDLTEDLRSLIMQSIEAK